MSSRVAFFLFVSMLWAGTAWAERVVTGLHNPESVLATPDGRIYVSEIGEFGKDGDGRISLIEGGKAKPYATGMDDPKGLAYVKGALYVADKARILKVDKGGKWRVFVPAEAFPAKPQFLNDLAADGAGNLYVSDSGDLNGKGGAVYRISPQGKVSVVVSDLDKRVLAPNGLLPDGEEKMLMVDFFSGVLYRITLKTGGMVTVAEGFGGGDGIVRDRRGVLWISDWKNGRVFSLKPDGELKLAKAGYQSAADIGLSPDGRFILVPDMKAGELHWLPIGG